MSADSTPSSIQIQILSDLHLESPSSYDIFTVPIAAPILALLGDIGNTRDRGFIEDFLITQLLRYEIVFLVLGNHEPYYSSFEQAKEVMREFERDWNSGEYEKMRAKRSRAMIPPLNSDMARNKCEGSGGEEPESRPGKFVLLDQTRYELDRDGQKVTILGCTLFSYVGPQDLATISLGLQDFYNISGWTVERHVDAHKSDVEWLNSQVSSVSKEDPERSIVILTHHNPTLEEWGSNPRYYGHKFQPGFCSDLTGQECWENSSVRIWAFGHTHFNIDYQYRIPDGALDGQAVKQQVFRRVVTNQRGYYHSQAEGFDRMKVLVLSQPRKTS